MEGTYIQVGKYKLDLTEGTPVPITRTIADIMEPDKRKKSQSKTFIIPGTKNNMWFFQSAYSLTWRVIDGNPIGVNYNISELFEAQYYFGGRVQFSGALQLLNVSVINGQYEFEVVLFSDVVSIFQKWGDLKVSELGWEEYDHTLNETNVDNSWDTSVIQNGGAVSNFTAGVPDGFGYLYGLVDYGFSNDLDKYKDSDIVPQVYYKEIIEKAFEKYGYTVDDTFIGTERFKRCVLGYGGGDKFQLTSAQLTAIAYDLTGDGSFSKTSNFVQNNLIPEESGVYLRKDFIFHEGNPDYTVSIVADPSNQATTGKVTVPVTGTYRQNIAFTMTYNIATNGTGTADIAHLWQLRFVKNGQPNIIDLQTFDGTAAGATYVVDLSFDVDLRSGDVCYFELAMQTTGSFDSPTYDFGDVTFDGDFNNTVVISQDCINSVIENGSTVRLAAAIPDLKVVDFMKGIINHFRLNVSDPDADGIVYIEPALDFYEDNANNDVWTKDIDFEQKIDIEPIAINQPKHFNWRFATDVDYYRKVHRDLFGIGYGDYSFENPSFFATGETTVELPYTITPPVARTDSNLIVPRLIEKTNGVVKPFKGKPRMYYYQGLQTGAWTLINSATLVERSKPEWPALHHVDDTAAPTFDLCFGTPRQVFYTATDYTTDNVFTVYLEPFINEVTSVDSKMLKANFWLNEDQTREQTLKRVKNIDGTLYRVNQIIDFVPGRSTRCELIKILEVQSKATFDIGNVINTKSGQFETYDSSDTEFGFRTFDDFAGGAVSDKYDLYNCDCSLGDCLVGLDNNFLRTNHWFSIRKKNAGGDVVITAANGKTINGETTVRIGGVGNSFRIKWDGTEYTVN